MWWADIGSAHRYDPSQLSAEDARRQHAARGAKAQEEWRVSRALLQDVRAELAPGGVTSLSHSGGHAVCAATSVACPLGVDLERIRQRDVARLAQWVCSPAEREALAGLDGTAQLEHFYLLWTLKEAFIKAMKQDFPAYMSSIGLDAGPDAKWRLRVPEGKWHACSYRLGEEWISSVVWRAGAGAPVRPRWRTATACVLPAVAILGEWMSDPA